MSDSKIDPSLLALQDQIWRDKVLQARAMTPEERCSDVFLLTTFQLELQLAGALHRIKGEDLQSGWAEVKKGTERLCLARDHQFYTATPPA